MPAQGRGPHQRAVELDRLAIAIGPTPIGLVRHRVELVFGPDAGNP